MEGRKLAFFLFLVCALAAASYWFAHRSILRARAGTGSDTTYPPHVILITSSGLRATHLSSYLYRHSQTPAIDSFAYSGVRLTNAFTASTESLSSHLSLLSARYPFRQELVQVLKGQAHLPSFSTLPIFLKKFGYHTAAFVADPELRHPVLIKQFDHYDKGDSNLPIWERAYENGELSRKALNWIRAKQNHKLFVLVNFGEPTPPFSPPHPYDKQYRSHLYDGEIAALDEEIGRFVNSLRRMNVLSRSVIIFTSAFGADLNDQPEPGSVERDSIRVPLLFLAPGLLPVNREYNGRCSLIDIPPTVAKLLGKVWPHQTDGMPLFESGNEREINRKWIFGSVAFRPQLGFPYILFAENGGTLRTIHSGSRSAPLAGELQKLGVEKLPPPFPADRNQWKRLEMSVIQARRGNYVEATRTLNSLQIEGRFLRQLRQDLHATNVALQP